MGSDVIMTKEMLDISREDSATEAPQFQELISPSPMRPQNHMQGGPHPELIADRARKGTGKRL